MPRVDIDDNFIRIRTLADEIDRFVPRSAAAAIPFRGDMAGLLVVLIVATYENCVKESLISFANTHHVKFGDFARNNFSRLNSRIALDDLHRYAKAYGDNINENFKLRLRRKKERIEVYTGQDLRSHYKQLLDWRHDFAHAGNRNTTVEEAFRTHRLAKHVLYVFDDALQSGMER